MGWVNSSSVLQLTTSMNNPITLLIAIPYVLFQVLVVVIHFICCLIGAAIAAPFALVLFIYAVISGNKKDGQ